MPKPSHEDYAGLIVEFLKDEKNIPHFIKRNSYHRRCHLCKNKHEGFLIKDFDSKNKIFTIIHGDESGKFGVITKQTPSELHKFLTQCFQRRHVKAKDLRKKINVKEFEKTSIIQVRVTKREKLLLEEKSRKKKITISQYVRSKIFE